MQVTNYMINSSLQHKNIYSLINKKFGGGGPKDRAITQQSYQGPILFYILRTPLCAGFSYWCLLSYGSKVAAAAPAW